MEKEEIHDSIWKSAIVGEKNETRHCRMDAIWAYLSSLKNPDGSFKFPKLSKVALLILVIPHSNAEEERVFSMINKNKTKFRPNLKLDGTLSSILTVKLANPESLQPCHKYEPARRIFKTAKKATMEYNKIHSSNHSMSSSTLPSSSNLHSSSS